jgi:hypothetical protein
MKRKIVVTLVFLFSASLCAGEEKIENWPDGTMKKIWHLDGEGKLDGKFGEYFETGKIKIRTQYKAGELDGDYTEYYENGAMKIKASYDVGKLDGKYVEYNEKRKAILSAEYKDGLLHGEYKASEKKIWFPEQLDPADKLYFFEGALIHTRSFEEMSKTLKTFKLESKGATPEDALALLKAYRYVCGVPWEDIVLDPELNSYGVAGAAICERIGRLDHTPKNPGMPEKDYQYAYFATSHSNLHMGTNTTIANQVNGYMDDSDASNIDRVGHRRWCLNPGMLKVGFGKSGNFCAMMAHDNSRAPAPDWDYILYPSRGYMPLQYFGPEHAWCILLNPAKYGAISKDNVKVEVYPIDEKNKKAKESVKLNYFNVETSGFGHNVAIIFRPGVGALRTGSMFMVETSGLKKTGAKDDAGIKYIVEFVNENEDPKKVKKKRKK